MICQYSIIQDNEYLPKLKIEKEFTNNNFDINSVPEVIDYFYNVVDCGKYFNEYAWVVSCDISNRVKGFSCVSIGDYNKSYFYSRTVMTFLLLTGAEKAIFIHNHPNKEPHRSDADVEVMQKHLELCNMFGLVFGGDYIVSNGTYTDVLTGKIEEIMEYEGE